MRKTHRTVALTVLLVLASLSGPVGTAAAADSIDHCSEIDEFLWVLSIGQLNEHCDSSKLADAMQQIKQSADSQTHLDLYEGLAAQDEQAETTLNSLASYRQDSRTTAFVRAENATIQALQAGKSKSEVKTTARQTVLDYYTRAQHARLAEAWDISATQLQYVRERAANESGLTPRGIVRVNATLKNGTADTWHAKIVGWNQTTVTLANGTSRTVTAPRVELRIDTFTDDSISANTRTRVVTPRTGEFTVSMMTRVVTFHGFTVKAPPGSSLQNRTYLPAQRWHNVWSNTSQTATMVADNAEVYATKLYEAEQNGTVNASEYVSPYVMAQEYATQYNETGYWSYAISSLSAAGLSTPSLNGTGVMTVAYRGTLYEGLIMSDSAPNGTWQTGVDYHPANISGRQWLVTTSGERIVLDDTFRIKMMTNAQGEKIQQTETVQYVYRSNNVTEFKQLQDRILQLQRQIESRTPKTTGGGWGGVSGQSAIVLVLAGAAAVLILNNT